MHVLNTSTTRFPIVLVSRTVQERIMLLDDMLRNTSLPFLNIFLEKNSIFHSTDKTQKVPNCSLFSLRSYLFTPEILSTQIHGFFRVTILQ